MNDRLRVVKVAPPERAFCNECGNDTLHNIISSVGREFNENIGDSVATTYETIEILECCGCESIKARRTLEKTGLDEVTTEYFPPVNWRRSPSWLSQAPEHIRKLLSQVYSAMCVGWNRLAALGTRAVIDDVILDEVGDQGTFQNKLASLIEKELISRREVEQIKAALEPGHAAMHRGAEPSDNVMEMVIDIVESLVRNAYVLPNYPRLIMKDTPRRNENIH